MGEKYEVEVKTISKLRAEYQTAEYLKLGLPPAPAAMVGEEVVGQGPNNISEEKVEAAIRRHLGLPELPPEAKKGFLERLLKK